MLQLFAVITVVVCGAVFLVRRYGPAGSHERRLRNGHATEATVVSVEPMNPEENGGLGRPYTVRFSGTDGALHLARCTDGFGGALPREGMRVRIRSDPKDPLTLRVLDAPEPPRARTLVLRRFAPVVVLVCALILVLLVWSAMNGVSTAEFAAVSQALMAATLVLFGLVAACFTLVHIGSDITWSARSARVRGTVTHSWTRFARYPDDDVPLGLSHPFVVAFELADGRRFHTHAPEPTAYFRPRRGRAVTILHDPDRPTRFQVGEVIPGLLVRRVTHLAIIVGIAVTGVSLASSVDVSELSVVLG